MKLSIIIVNYNVRYFLEQCLQSVKRAAENLPVEVFVVDNNSVDGSGEMIREKFPWVKLIANQKNLGFSGANNQGIKQACGEYILLLNPDTVVEEDTFLKTVSFMDQNPDAGGLGVKMINGKGEFLPESKRGLPRPDVAFYKVFGLSALFPRSRRFGKYHLGYLDKDQVNQVEVLSGAFMLIRKTVLDEIGLLDETFFMYGEDIDLSYRITQAGYKNYYFPKTRIIHYKGESTKKSSINYVMVFYKAMLIFANKHFSKKNAAMFSWLINFAIYFRAFVAILNRFIKRATLPAIDFMLLLIGMHVLKHYYHGITGISFDEYLVSIAFTAYSFIWITTVFLNGGYDKPLKLKNAVIGILTGTAIILITYSLLSEEYRFSRALILLGTAWAIFVTLGARWILHLANVRDFRIADDVKKRIAIVGDRDEAERIKKLLSDSNILPEFVVTVSPDPSEKEKSSVFIAKMNQLEEVLEIFKIDEVIFSSKSIPANEIINQMSLLNKPGVDYKIAPPESIYIIGSNSINTSGDLYVMEFNSITRNTNKRKKRILDLFLSLMFLVFFPVLVLLVKHPTGFFRNILQVLIGARSWVGYVRAPQATALPAIRKGVLTPLVLAVKDADNTFIDKVNFGYARDYTIANDLKIIQKGWKDLGNS